MTKKVMRKIHIYNIIPGFQGKRNKAGFCTPCCFGKWDGAVRERTRGDCLTGVVTKQKKGKQDLYIMGKERFPMRQGRYGFLPIGVEKFFEMDNKKCYIADVQKLVGTCIVHKGMEQNDNQSFIAYLADLSTAQGEPIPTIHEMKQRIILQIDLDSFITYQNGSLVDIFGELGTNVNINKYAKTNLWKRLKLKLKKGSQLFNERKIYFQKVISAFTNFKKFLNDDTIKINHEYLWDFVVTPNGLFEEGCNLVILRIPDNDVTNNIELICPTNHYSSEIFSLEKETTFVMLKDNLYEPIYGILPGVDERKILKFFSQTIADTPNPISKILPRIFTLLQNQCSPKKSLPHSYKYKPNLTLEQLQNELSSMSPPYVIKSAILNYNSRVIGVIAKTTKKKSGFIPCRPSAILPNLEKKMIHMDNPTILKSYAFTKAFLENVHKQSSETIPCKPIIKVVDEGPIVGIITETDQFIPVIPTEYVEDDLKSIRNYNFSQVDKDTTLIDVSQIDEERIKMTKKNTIRKSFL